MDFPCKIRPDHNLNDYFPVGHYQISSEYKLQCWLEEYGLGHYFETFLLNDVTDLHLASRLQLTDALYDELEMHVPAHRKRLRKAGGKVKEKHRFICDFHQTLV